MKHDILYLKMSRFPSCTALHSVEEMGKKNWQRFRRVLKNRYLGVLHGRVEMYLTYNPGVLGSSCTGSCGFFVGVSADKTLQSLSLVLVKPRKDMNYVICRSGMTELC